MESNTFLSLFGILTTIYGVYMAYRSATSAKAETPAQEQSRRIAQETETLNWYRNQIEDREKHEKELEQQVADEKQKKAASEAAALKREIELKEDYRIVKASRDSYALAYAEIRRIAVKYVPKDVVLPEVNGNSTPEWKR